MHPTPAERSAVTEAVVALLEQAMMTGFLCISDRRQAVLESYAADPDVSGGDMLRAALGEEPREFTATRRDLVDEVLEKIAQAIDAERDREDERLGHPPAGALGNWLGGFKESAKLVRGLSDR